MVGMITNISDHKDTKFLSYDNTLSVEIKFHWQIIAFFLLYRWHSYINNVSLFTFAEYKAIREFVSFVSFDVIISIINRFSKIFL